MIPIHNGPGARRASPRRRTGTIDGRSTVFRKPIREWVVGVVLVLGVRPAIGDMSATVIPHRQSLQRQQTARP